MFYSQTFLARKGPLGTVWCAAHMQGRLKKSHYTSTDIPSTVERIMFPEVPLALRMSSHLLLGVVRIYSKKVDILYDECNSVLTRLRKAFASIDLNLPEDARQAPIQAITLPDTFDLDAMDLDVDLNLDGDHNHHNGSQDDITLTDQIPSGVEPYVSISFDEDFMMDISHPTEARVPDSAWTATDQNVDPPAVNTTEGVPSPSTQIAEEYTRQTDENTLQDFIGPEAADIVFQDTGPSNQSEMQELRLSNDNSPEEILEVEVMRNAIPDSLGNPPLCPNSRTDIPQPQASSDQIMHDKETLSPIIEKDLTSGGQTLPYQPGSIPQASGASLQEGLLNDNAPVSFAIRSTPPVEKPKARPRKRKQCYDEAPVLTNKFMKKALEDPSDLMCKRRKIPCSALGIWKLKKNLRKEKVFIEPLITGLCLDLHNIYDKDYMSTKLQSLKNASPDSGVAGSPATETEASPQAVLVQSPAAATETSPQYRDEQFHTPLQDYVQEIERLRHVVSHDEPSRIPHFIPSSRATPPLERDEFGPSTTQTFQLTPVTMAETTIGTGEFPMSDFMASSRLGESDLETHAIFDERTDLENTVLSDVAENSAAEGEEFAFLDADNNTPAGSQGARGVDSLSVRTRAVAQFLKRQSPITPVSGNSYEELSLNKLLEGKTRKRCAQMFFETLVLKSNGLVDVIQVVPYGDITLKLTPELSKTPI